MKAFSLNLCKRRLKWWLRFCERSGLAVAMSSTLSLNVGLTDSYNSRPPAGQKSNDIGVFTGVNIKLGAN